jgi:replicative DNA helicase
MAEAQKLRRFRPRKAVDDVRFYRNNPGVLRGISTGNGMLDYITGGLKREELIVLAARPGVGKSALAQEITERAEEQGKNVGWFSLEMSEEQVLWRGASKRSGIPGRAIEHGYYWTQGEKIKLREQDYALFEAALEVYRELNIGIHVGGITTEAIARIIRDLQGTERALDMVVIDHIGLLTDNPSQPQYQRMTAITRAIKDMKLEFKIPILALAQLNRSVEQRDDKRPVLSDLRDSGSIEQDADQVWFLYRPDYYEHEEVIDDMKPSKLEVSVAKNRNGSTGVAYIQFLKSTTRFYEHKEDLQKPMIELPDIPIRHNITLGDMFKDAS